MAAACCIAGIASLAALLAGHHNARPVPVESTPRLRAAVSVSDRADRLQQIIGGTAQQQAAAAYLSYRRANDAIASCMQKWNMDYRVPLFVAQRRGNASDSLSGTTMLARLDDPVVSREARAERSAQRTADAQQSAAARPVSKDYRSQLAVCQKHRGSLAPSYPPLRDKLQAAFRKVIYGVDGRLSSRRPAYESCMARYGYKAQSYYELP